MYQQDTTSALDAITEAQRIAFAPMLFQAALCLRNSGVLAYLDQQGQAGATLPDIVANVNLDDYAVGVLLDMGLSGRIVICKEHCYRLTKVGHFLLHDTMTRLNMDFTQHVCYQGLFFLHHALEQSKPVGLQVFSTAPTIYPVLAQLPPAARDSWFAFDHYYSDAAFNAALPYVFASQPDMLFDVGGNTGKWALKCCAHDPNISITILDLPAQIKLARQTIENAGLMQRVYFHEVDMLDATTLPGAADIWWMSQFLDCFAPPQIINMLQRIASVMQPGAKLCIMELFWDAQKFEAAAFSLNATSLYFTCMANGNSRFYSVDKFYSYLDAAGLQVEQRIDNLGLGHTLLICQPRISAPLQV